MPGIENLLVGRVLGGRYRIEEVIGRGGMGAVYRALDERLGRAVALKVITAGGTGEAEARERLRARFFREARSAAALPHHPNVVPVYDYGSDEALGLDYLVMELLRGSDLATRLARSGPPPLAASLKILLEAARGVAVGHRQGLIHRDIKPGNIFLTEPHRNEVQVRVVDFGIAKVADEDDTLAQLTQDGRVPHSPAYASPEQLRGLSQLTPASDVFSLGAVGYQLLTGERPFSESDRNRMSLGMPVEPPPLRTKNPAIPGTVEAVIRRALAFEPQERFADAGGMARALEEAMRAIGDLPVEPYLAGAAIVTASTGEPPAAADDDRTRVFGAEDDDRTLLAPAPAPPPVAAHPTRSAAPPPRGKAPPPRRPERRRRGAGGFLVWLLVLGVLAAATIWGINEMRAPVAFDLPPAPDSIDVVPPQVEVEVDQPEVEPALQAYLSNEEGIRYFERQQYDSAMVHFQRAVDIDPLNPDYRRNYGLALLQLGAPEDAQVHLRRAVELAPDRADTYESLYLAQLAAGDTAAAIASLEGYLQRERAPGRRALAENRLARLRAAQEANLPPLLGDRVEPEPPPVVPADTGAIPSPAPTPPPDTAGPPR